MSETATKTVDQHREAEYKRALERADQEGITVRRVSDQAFIAKNPTSGKAYLVAIRRSQLECDCQAGQNDKYCKHRAKVRAAIIAERAQAAEEAANRLEEVVKQQEATKQLRFDWLASGAEQKCQACGLLYTSGHNEATCESLTASAYDYYLR